ncbi:helix-turn-helix domain-containing protein [Actinocorallia sp. A-T 12471]|uniref:TetR/AcrR family transcriptional regulator n=1 Tax=Actinocorallia sp. A-T 12471 TaxID=3089813 RepID=UPI0029CC2E8B|nr:helix-turn-helix domain-containing protein [Actinocorallia sp. A-T 12471]MDX6739998.1 helix-turn-helix domain-containing protein [Actinocorallia sp. A-T 12471]
MSFDRDLVLHRAADLLSRKATATQDEIARAAGISRATLHRHFAGRDSLIRALEDLALRQLQEVADAARLDEGSATEALERLIEGSRPVAGFLAFLSTENQLFEGEEVNAGWERLDARISALFRRGQESGEFRLDLSPAWLTEALYGLVAAAAWTIQAGKTAPRDYTMMISGLLLGGAARRPPLH